MGLYAIQWGGSRFHHGTASLMAPLVMLGLSVVFGVLVLPLLEWVVPRQRRAFKTWRTRRRGLRSAATAERRARALMSELCPFGWRARITLFEGHSSEDDDLPEEVRDRVALDWTEIRDERGRPAVERRVWAPTIAAALEAMVADRRTDETLEQIERGAIADGALWEDA